MLKPRRCELWDDLRWFKAMPLRSSCFYTLYNLDSSHSYRAELMRSIPDFGFEANALIKPFSKKLDLQQASFVSHSVCSSIPWLSLPFFPRIENMPMPSHFLPHHLAGKRTEWHSNSTNWLITIEKKRRRKRKSVTVWPLNTHPSCPLALERSISRCRWGFEVGPSSWQVEGFHQPWPGDMGRRCEWMLTTHFRLHVVWLSKQWVVYSEGWLWWLPESSGW